MILNLRRQLQINATICPVEFEDIQLLSLVVAANRSLAGRETEGQPLQS